MATHSGEPEGDVGVLFHGELELSSDPESRLVVTLTMESDSLSLATGDEKLGTWNRPEAKAVEISRGRYDLTLGNETLIFTPENGPLFASRGLPYFNEPEISIEPAGLLSKIKKWGLKPTDFATQLGMTPTAPSPDTQPDQPVGPLDAAASSQRDAPERPEEPLPTNRIEPADRPADDALPPAPAPPVVHQPTATGSMAMAQSGALKYEPPRADMTDANAQLDREEPVRGPLATDLSAPAERPTTTPPAPLRGPQPIERPTIQMNTEPARPSPIPIGVQPPATQQPAVETGPGLTSVPVPSKPANPRLPHERPDVPVIPDLAGLLARLDSAIHDLQEGRMEPDRGRAIADVVRAMCLAVEVSGGGAKALISFADKLDDGGRLGDDVIEDQE